MRIRLGVLFVFALARLAAQQGDRGAEIQTPLPPDLIIPPSPALSPDEELKTLKIAPGFRMELVAADPLVHDPVVIQFAPDGKMWVVEMIDYMPNVDGVGEDAPIGDIAVLEDTDGDGRMDKRTVFADGLVMPRAISLIDGGALVAAPTHLWYYKDTNGDGLADQKTEIAANYGNTSGPEHNANGLMWAMDNWIYSANHTFRYRYEGGGKFKTDATITRGQWGISQDDVGHLFYNSNSDPLRVDLLPSAYLTRNPNFQAGGTNAFLAPTSLPVWPSRMTPGINRGYNTLNDQFKESAVTSAGGPVIYRGTLFPAEFRGNAFINEPTGNLVKRLILDQANGGMAARNAYEGTEFITSTDERFRPVNLFNGPDGALYVVDMYRGIIQHRVFVTTFLRNQILSRNLETPIHLGRIWRIVPDGATRPVVPNLARATPAELIRQLDSPNGWTRDTAQRLLVEKLDPSVAPALRTAAGTAATPLGKVHALWALDGLNSLDRPTAMRALADADPRVVVAAIRVSEPLFAVAATADVLDRAISLASSTDPSVRLQLALSLGQAKTPAADAALRKLALAAPDQPFLNDAIISSLAGREDKVITALVADAKTVPTPPSAIVSMAVNAVLKSYDTARIDLFFDSLLGGTSPDWAKTAMLDGIQAFVPGGAGGGRGGARGGGGGRAAAPAATAPARAGAAADANPPATADAQTAPIQATPRGAAAARGGGGGRGGGRGNAALAGGNLPKEPRVLVALANNKADPNSARATTLLEGLKWPGKPGLAALVPLTSDQERLFEIGRTRFNELCATCHQPNGQGQAGLAPALVNSQFVLGDDRILARIILAGKVQQNQVMPAMRGLFDDENIAGLMTYIRRAWGHGAAPVSPAIVTEARAAVATRQEPWTDTDLENLLKDLTQAAPPAGRGPP